MANIYSTTILGKSYEISRKLPPRLKSSPEQGRLHNIIENPLLFQFGLIDENDIHFRESKKQFDNSLIKLDGRITNKDFKLESERKYPNLSKRKALDTYSRELFKEAHSQVLEKEKSILIERFESNFFAINSETIAVDKFSEFSRPTLSCDESVIYEFEQLAKQGHVFSQFMAGLLHTTQPGEFSKRGIPFLISAYENRFPMSMDILAEFLLFRKDYVGAIQCSLLSIDSLDGTKSTMRNILQHMYGMIIPHNMMPLSIYIFQFVLDDDFKSLGKKHFPEFYPSEEELKKQAIDRLIGMSGDIQ